MADPKLKRLIDISQAEEFLTALDFDHDINSIHTFQTFDDNQERMNKTFARKKSGSFESCKDRLIEVNCSGGGCFVTVNETDGKGRKEKNIIDVRASFMDFDGGIEPPEELFEKFHPHIVIQSKNGKHLYWLLDRGQDKELWKRVQKALIKKYNSDPKVKDLPRVMRIPGFLHRKNDAFLVEIRHCDSSTRVRLKDIINALDLNLEEDNEQKFGKLKEWDQSKVKNDDLTKALLKRFWAAAESLNPPHMDGSRHDTLLKIVGFAWDLGLTSRVGFSLIKKWFIQSCEQGWSEEKLEYQYRSMLEVMRGAEGNRIHETYLLNHDHIKAADVVKDESVPWSDEYPFVRSRCNALQEIDDKPDDRSFEPISFKYIGLEQDESDIFVLGLKEKKKKKEKLKAKDINFAAAKEIKTATAKTLICSGKRPPRCTSAIFGDLAVPVAYEIMDRYDILTDKSEQFYVYVDNVWEQQSKSLIKKMANQFYTDDNYKDKTINDVVNRIKSDKYMANPPWNNIENMEIALKDGILNILTGKIRSHSPNDYLDRIIPIEYDPNAECPLWLKCLEDWLPSPRKDSEKIAIQEFFGYILMSKAKYKKALLLYGDSDTGKSQICAVARELAGGEKFICSILPSNMGDPRQIANIKGKTLNLYPDMPKNQLIDDGGFKMLVSTGEPVTLDQKNVKQEIYTPSAKHMFSCNNLPSINDRTKAVFRRLLLIHFDRSIPLEDQDSNLDEKLLLELSGILNWAIEGARRLYKSDGKWTIPEASKKLLDEYQKDNNPLYEFIEESRLVKKSDGALSEISSIVKLFNSWYKPRSDWKAKSVRECLRSLGYKDGKRVDNKRTVEGLELADSSTQQVLELDKYRKTR